MGNEANAVALKVKRLGQKTGLWPQIAWATDLVSDEQGRVLLATFTACDVSFVQGGGQERLVLKTEQKWVRDSLKFSCFLDYPK